VSNFNIFVNDWWIFGPIRWHMVFLLADPIGEFLSQSV
jgi:hypothetical protein